MLLNNFATILNAHGIDPKVSIVVSLFDDVLDMFGLSFDPEADNRLALVSLRAKLLGTSEHEVLVNMAIKSGAVMAEVENHKKIMAIKKLRDLSGAGLKANKDAVEDSRVWGSFYHPNI